MSLTSFKATTTPGDVTTSWFEAWGTWAGGLVTGAAFLVAAYSVAVSGAHAHKDRAEAADVRKNQDMAQARLLVVYPVDMPRTPQSFRFFRIDNRSKDWFFDVTVPSAERYQQGEEMSLLTKEAFTGPGTVTMEYLPEEVFLSPYRTNDQDDTWNTEVRVYAAPDTPVRFSVYYTDANGLRWKQSLDGKIERVLSTTAVPAPRRADSEQPQSQVQTVTPEEAKARRVGGPDVPDFDDEDDDDSAEIEAVGRVILETWKPISRIGAPIIRPDHFDPEMLSIDIGYAPDAPQPWYQYFKEAIRDAGIRSNQGHSQGPYHASTFKATKSTVPLVIERFDAAVKSANERFENEDMVRIRQHLAKVDAAQEAANARQAELDDLADQFRRPGRLPWARRDSPGANDHDTNQSPA
ncbi:hypothetical protein [Mycolicibacterium mengxianglii]|uniref:hypothetical protein n=1 Tax=Mycolicibacterium mengxianglii TaxID=2736649 RepID=UPI0018D0ADB1|nr:hypothetical protein [Mycolicibacterium mengxianglii]